MNPSFCQIHRDFRDDILGCYTNYETSIADQDNFGAYDDDCKELRLNL